MKKIPCLFVRNFFGKKSFEITREVTKGCEWVINGEGTASIKRDGTDCAVINAPRDFDALGKFLFNFDSEWVVFSHPDGRKCKIRKADFWDVRKSAVKKQNGVKK